ncbi:hypothetical protein JOQ06_017015 [Pogonophryne albipinna]|uniref:Uncharacterized protein n=1 Tax=Pogonophryne albipinna TaxID=1090488 RepID=A0AAD6B2G2_9TELE|nr:hypothetical protein JOQ06_017015 [Pogonophryne albipinna]
MAFTKTIYSFEVKENTVPGTVVGKVGTVFEALTPIKYSVQEDDGENLFLLSPFSGEFLLSRSLDFEAQRFYILTVVVQQGDSKVSSVRVYFNVLDVNANPPVFSQDTFSALLLEDTVVGTCFLALIVSDKDDGDNGALKLTVAGGADEGMFFINRAGSLCLKTELDRERQPFYNLTVTANDCVQPVSLQFTTTANVIVVVGDINDNAPSFVSAKTISIPEDTALHSVIMTLHAEDKDTGSNGEVLYYLNNTSSGIFSIDNRSGKIYLEEALDREQVDTMTITVTVTDKGSPRMATTGNITVHVEDVNDHDPKFSQSTFSLTVREDAPRGTSLFQVQALDRDIGTNGQVRYILTQTSPFVVDSVRGVITVMEKLDRERNSNYTLIITAVDQGDINRSSTATISLTVLDVNDFAPIFTPQTLTLHVMENEEAPSQLTHQISALDEDLGINSLLTYFIHTGNSDGLFSVIPNGTFQIVHSLDREKESLYSVTIIAVDSGLPPLTGTLTLHVIVDDVNDNSPEFSEEVYNTIVSEGCSTGTVFAMITASDIDEGLNGEIRYSMENLDVPFAIEETSGELLTTKVLDRETVAIYRLMVIGSDKHPTQPMSSSVLVTVLIGDINDHRPQFLNSPYVAYVPTEMAPGSVVCALRATDEDTEMNAELHYSLYGQSSDLFSIQPYSGTVFTSSALWRTEAIVVNVHVEDAGENPKFDVTTISIRFQNASEFPEINVSVISGFLSEDTPVGTLVAVVSAASIRAEPVFFYLASGNLEDMFHVEQASGVLTVENPLDYENKKEFTLLVEARDSGSPPFSSFAEIHINISDINDNFPHFTQAEYRCEVFENSPPSWVCDVLAIDADSGSYGTVHIVLTETKAKEVFVMQVFATDADMGQNCEIVYAIEHEHEQFWVNASSVLVAVRDAGVPPLSSTTMIHIKIMDENDNPSLPRNIFIEVKYFGSAFHGGLIGNVHPEDQDESDTFYCAIKRSFYCHCQSGFSGLFCSPDEDKCLKVKCQNGGTCIPTQDGYHCRCVPGFEGEMCEQPTNHCRSGPCVEGSCTNSPTGFSCQCPFGVSGVHCEEHSYGFEELSFMEFPPLDRRTNLISLEFATVQRKSLLLYNPGGSSSREFFALEILDGAIHLSYDLGSGPVRLHTNKQVADGYFHSVTARRIGNMGSLHVDNCTDEENTGFCFSQSDGSSLKRTLDVGSNMTFGGTNTFESVLLHPGQIKTHDFVGCIRNTHVNGILLRPSMALATYNILNRCPRTTASPCQSNPCKNGGVCHDLWSYSICECKSIFTGSNCAKEMSEELVLRFNGNEYIEYVIKERFKRDYLLKGLLDDNKEENNRDQRVVEIKFKTQEDGVLISVVEKIGFSMLKIKDRRPVYIFKDTLSGHESEFPLDSPVADGVWHVLTLLSNGQTTFLLLDNTSALNITEHRMDLSPVRVEKIILGAAVTGFTGCVQYFTVSGYTLPVSGHSEMVEVRPSSTLIKPGCSPPAVCLPCSEEDTTRGHCLSALCQNRLGGCGRAEQNTSCVCLHNVSDHACDICLSTTESRNQCPQAQVSVHLWLLALILPLISILVIIGICVAIYKVRRHKAEGQTDNSQQKTEQGTGNVVFCFDDNRTLTYAENKKQNVPIRADQPRLNVEFYGDASLSSVLPVPNNELEDYEIGSICSELHSDTASLTLSWHKHLYSTKCVKVELKRRGDLRGLLAGFKKEHSSEERATCQTKPQDIAFLNKQLLTKIDLQYAPLCHKKRLVELEFLDPVQCLTFEEISKLNTPQDKTMSHRASLRSGPTKSHTLINGSSDSETDSTFTCSESECGQFACSFRQQGILPVSTFLKHTCPSDAGQDKAESAPSSMFEQWGNILNMHLPFSSYAPVFEDIACLPTDQMYSYEMQSDIEEII